MRIISLGMKGWKKDNGTWSWTPEAQLEYESDAPLLREQQVKDVEAGFEQLKDLIRRAVEGPPKTKPTEARTAHEDDLAWPEGPYDAPRELTKPEPPKAPAPAPAPAQDAPKAAEPTPAPPKAEKPAEAAKAPSTKGPATLEGFDGKRIEAFDKDKPGWVCCPQCGNTDITHPKPDGKRGTWQGCYECGIFLNQNGKTAPMGGK